MYQVTQICLATLAFRSSLLADVHNSFVAHKLSLWLDRFTSLEARWQNKRHVWTSADRWKKHHEIFSERNWPVHPDFSGDCFLCHCFWMRLDANGENNWVHFPWRPSNCAENRKTIYFQVTWLLCLALVKINCCCEMFVSCQPAANAKSEIS